MKRAWKDRLARNCEELTPELVERFYEEEGLSDAALGNGKKGQEQAAIEFLEWVGLSVSPTGIQRARRLMNKVSKDDALKFGE